LEEGSRDVPSTANLLFQADGFSIFEDDSDCYVTDGFSAFHLKLDQLEGHAYLHPSFYSKPAGLQCNFWSFGLLKLLRSTGFYSVHAAAVAAHETYGVLIAGPSGSGKSTLAVGLIREGWQYLSDDAVLLGLRGRLVTAYALRKDFYVEASATSRYADLPIGPPIADSSGGSRCRLGLEKRYVHQKIESCIPKVVLFPKISEEERSRLSYVDPVTALKHLLNASGPQLFDRATMRQHLGTLKLLLNQAAAYRLQAGRDVRDNRAVLLRLLKGADMGGLHAHGR